MQVARDMDKASFQGTLHKYINGRVPNPTRQTAQKIAKHFGLPIDALYDRAMAARLAAERGLSPTRISSLAAAEPIPKYFATASPKRRLSRALELRIEGLTNDQVRGLESVLTAYLDAVAPKGAAKNTGT